MFLRQSPIGLHEAIAYFCLTHSLRLTRSSYQFVASRLNLPRLLRYCSTISVSRGEVDVQPALNASVHCKEKLFSSGPLRLHAMGGLIESCLDEVKGLVEPVAKLNKRQALTQGVNLGICELGTVFVRCNFCTLLIFGLYFAAQD